MYCNFSDQYSFWCRKEHLGFLSSKQHIGGHACVYVFVFVLSEGRNKGPCLLLPSQELTLHKQECSIRTIEWMNGLVIFIGLGIGLFKWGRTCRWGGELGDGRGWAAQGRVLLEVIQVHWGQRLPGREEGAHQGRCPLQILVECFLYPWGQERRAASLLASFFPQFPCCRKPRFQAGVVFLSGTPSLYASSRQSRVAESLPDANPGSTRSLTSSVGLGWYSSSW